MKFFDRFLFDFNRDGKVDEVETYVGMQMMGSSRRENIVFPEDDYDELDEEIEMAGLDSDDYEDF